MDSALLEMVKFLHPVGTSTLRYGVTIPLDAQTERMQTVSKGGKITATILFGTEEPVVAEIRRLNNQPGHLQFRYENKAQERLRNYLAGVFDGLADGSLLQIEEVAPLTFQFKPILKTAVPSLHINDILFHQIEPKKARCFNEIQQVSETVASVEYDKTFTQSDYNGHICASLVKKGWNSEQRVIAELGLKCDFEKNGIWVEVEFGNARAYYQDYVKFMLAKKYRDARLGLLLCPTTSFASLLCELGRQRAHENVVRERPAVYSGMMSYEKAVRELPYLGFMFEMPIVVAGIGVKG